MAQKSTKYKKMGFGGGPGSGSNTQKTEDPGTEVYLYKSSLRFHLKKLMY
jgi:hypothetical protein